MQQPGDYVARGAPLFEFASSKPLTQASGPKKVTRLQQAAPEAGFLAKILVSGDYKSTEAGQPLAILVSDKQHISYFADQAPPKRRRQHTKW